MANLFDSMGLNYLSSWVNNCSFLRERERERDQDSNEDSCISSWTLTTEEAMVYADLTIQTEEGKWLSGPGSCTPYSVLASIYPCYRPQEIRIIEQDMVGTSVYNNVCYLYWYALYCQTFFSFIQLLLKPGIIDFNRSKSMPRLNPREDLVPDLSMRHAVEQELATYSLDLS